MKAPEELNYRQLLQQQLVKIRKLEARLEQAEAARREPLAIVGMACRLPGGVDSPEAFWELLVKGGDATSDVPPDRWDAEALYDPDPKVPGRICTRRGAFLRDVDTFDAGFFGIPPHEAERMDPQQRLMLEVSWEALERAGHAVDRRKRERVGVFVGVMNNDYGQRVLEAGGLEGIDASFMGARGNCAIAGRVSYAFGFQGPSLVLDTACSSSLVALHLASQSLRNGECSMALVGGVNLMLSPEVSVYLSRSGALSPDGQCKTFDASADGAVRAEACAVLVVERLSDALAKGRPVLAVLRGSAVGHDGPSSAFSVPSGAAQQAVVAEALKSAGVAPADVSYLEAHGTGTPLGDPIEVEAAWSALKEGRQGSESLWMGSVKTNIGYPEAASGVVGVMKVVLAMQHRQLPAHLHLTKPNPLIDFEGMGIRVPQALTPWEPKQGKRLAGVTSYGRAGTIAHVVLEEAAARAPVERKEERPEHVLMLSARSPEALRAQAERYARALKEGRAEPGDVCFTAAVGRMHLEHRLAVVGANASQLWERLEAAALGHGGRSLEGRVQGAPPKVAFVFAGEGIAWGLGRHLLETQPVFREALVRCEELLASVLGTPLKPGLLPRAGEPDVAHEGQAARAAVFAREWALAQLWRAWGVEPQVVVGQGVGEYVAGCVAGVFSLEEGLRLAVGRGTGQGYGVPKLLLVSGETGAFVGSEASKAEYWSRRGHAAADWREVARTLEARGVEVCLELGPRADAAERPGRMAWLASLRQGRREWEQLLETLGTLHVRGVEVDWAAYDAPYGRQRVVLPTYAFQRQRYWYTQTDARGQVRISA
jgi:acyl transferase domain-containing protein